MRLNYPLKTAPKYTTEGGKAVHINHEQQLKRTVMACLLWEQGFYESGTAIVDRIKELIPKCRTEFVAAVAVHARHESKLRHVPLLVVREMARHPVHKAVVGRLLPDVIARADELAEFLAIYWADDPNQPLSKQVKLGLAKAFQKFDAYQLAKYNRDGAVKLRDVAFLAHVKPWDGFEQAHEVKRTYKDTNTTQTLLRHANSTLAKLVEGRLETPDTWEVELSASKDKKASWIRLLEEKKLGALAFIRNLRNMDKAEVPDELIKTYAEKLDVKWVLPYQFITAARFMPRFEPMLEPLMLKAAASLKETNRLEGRTAVLVDVSGSMDGKLSSKSDATRVDVAAGLAVLTSELGATVETYTFSNHLVGVPPRRGFALRDAIKSSQPHSGTNLAGSLIALRDQVKRQYDRLIIITDEQSHDGVVAMRQMNIPRGYLINVASNQNGVGYPSQGYVHIDGWSEHTLRYVAEYEKEAQ